LTDEATWLALSHIWRGDTVPRGCRAKHDAAKDLVRECHPRAATSPLILAGLHAPLSNFGRAARQSTSVLICLGLAHAPSFLRAICSIPSFGIAKFAVNVCSPDANTIPTKMPTNRTAGIGREQTVTNIDVRGSAYFSRVSEHCADGCGRFGTGLNSLVGAPGRNRTSTPCGTRF
jgi:hypothetical protein